MTLLGRHHGTIRRVRALRRDSARRRAEGVFVAEGRHLAAEALETSATIELAVITAALDRDEEGSALLARLTERGIACSATSEDVMLGLQDARSPQPLLLVVRRAPARLAVGPGVAPLVAVAHGLQDPGNLGAVWRSADAAGASTFAVTGGGADPYHPRAVRASMGSVFRLPPVEIAADRLLDDLRSRRVRAMATVPRGGVPLWEADLAAPCALLFGGEGSGLPDAVRRRLDGELHVPMRTGVDSLSVASAAAVVLFEAARQRASGAVAAVAPDDAEPGPPR